MNLLNVAKWSVAHDTPRSGSSSIRCSTVLSFLWLSLASICPVVKFVEKTSCFLGDVAWLESFSLGWTVGYIPSVAVAMTDTFRIMHEGQEVGRISADSLEHSRRLKDFANLHSSEFIDDPQMVKLLAPDGKTAGVLNLARGYSAERLSFADSITAEKSAESSSAAQENNNG